MSRIGLHCILRSEPEDDLDTAKFVLYHWNVPTKTGKEYVYPGRVAVLDPTLTAICNVHGLVSSPILDARQLAHLVYSAAKEIGTFPDSIDKFSSFIIGPRKISTKINRRIIESEDATPYRQSEIDDITERAYAQLTDKNIRSFEWWDETRLAPSYPKWNRASAFEFHTNPLEDPPVPIYLLYKVDNGFCRVIVIDKTSSREMYHFELFGNRDFVLETLSGVGGESAKIRNKYLIGQPVRPEELMHLSDLPNFHECISKPHFGVNIFKPYSLKTIKLYRTILRYANSDK